MPRTAKGLPPIVMPCAAAKADAWLGKRLDGVLSPAEQAMFMTLTIKRRRRDWLCGRLAAKAAAARWLTQHDLVSLPVSAIEILNDETGQPFLQLPTPLSQRAHISISHCALGGLAAAHGSRVGIDWEPVAKRAPEVLDHFVCKSEAEQAHSPEGQTSLWTVKEAVLKLLGLGLAGGLKQIRWTCGRVELDGAARQRWTKWGSPELFVEQRFEDGCSIALAFII